MQTEQLVQSFESGSIAYLDGTFATHRNIIKSKLKTLGVQVKTTFDTTVTHIVVGHNPPDAWRLIVENSLKYLTEAQLYPLIKDVGVEDQFLIQEEKTGETQMAENLKLMLTSPDTSTVKVAVMMLKSGGLPQQLAEELLIVAKTNDDLKVRTEAKKILLTQGPPEWVELLKDSQLFGNISTIKQKETRAKLEKTAKKVGYDDAAYLSTLLYRYFGRGLGFALSSKRTYYRYEALRLLTKDGVLNFHAGVGYHNWQESEQESWYPSQKIDTGIPFPSDHPDPLSIRVLNLHNCKIDKISSEITVFPNLEEIDASHNAIKGLHTSLAQLTKLQKLNLSGNRFTEFPAVLIKMPWLKEIDFRIDAYRRETTNLEIPEIFREKNPGCVIKI